EKVSGESYGDFLRKKFFEPLAMKNTGVHSSTAVLEHEALGYQFEDGKFKRALNWDMSKAGGAGALYSTVGDLHRWNEGVFNGKVLKELNRPLARTIRGVTPEASPHPPVGEVVRPTTLIEAQRLGRRLGVALTIASETFQHTGSFKFRAAYHLASQVR